MYLDKIVTVSRLTPLFADSDKESYQTVGNYGAIRMNIQPASAELTAITNGAYGAVFRGFVSVSGIRVGDRITVSGTGEVYIVNGLQNHHYGPLPHLEVIMFKGDN